MQNENFFSNENLIAMMDGNVRAYKVINQIEAPEEKQIFYCTSCGFPVPENEWVSNHNCCSGCYMDYCDEQGSKHKEV